MDIHKQRIIELSALEGHDADIPSNIGRIPAPENPSSPITVASTISDFDKDIEKGATSRRESQASNHTSRTNEKTSKGEKGVEEADDPNIVTWDGPDDPENPMVNEHCLLLFTHVKLIKSLELVKGTKMGCNISSIWNHFSHTARVVHFRSRSQSCDVRVSLEQ